MLTRITRPFYVLTCEGCGASTKEHPSRDALEDATTAAGWSVVYASPSGHHDARCGSCAQGRAPGWVRECVYRALPPSLRVPKAPPRRGRYAVAGWADDDPVEAGRP